MYLLFNFFNCFHVLGKKIIHKTMYIEVHSFLLPEASQAP